MPPTASRPVPSCTSLSIAPAALRSTPLPPVGRTCGSTHRGLSQGRATFAAEGEIARNPLGSARGASPDVGTPYELARAALGRLPADTSVVRLPLFDKGGHALPGLEGCEVK